MSTYSIFDEHGDWVLDQVADDIPEALEAARIRVLLSIALDQKLPGHDVAIDPRYQPKELWTKGSAHGIEL